MRHAGDETYLWEPLMRVGRQTYSYGRAEESVALNSETVPNDLVVIHKIGPTLLPSMKSKGPLHHPRNNRFWPGS